MATRQKVVTQWEDDLIELVRDALTNPARYLGRTQVYGTKDLMVRIGTPARKPNDDGTLEIVITKKDTR